MAVHTKPRDPITLQHLESAFKPILETLREINGHLFEIKTLLVKLDDIDVNIEVQLDDESGQESDKEQTGVKGSVVNPSKC